MRTLSELIRESVDTTLNGFVILKPGFIEYDDKLTNMLKANGWNIVHKKRQKLTKDIAKDLYSMHSEKPFYNDLCDYMICDDCICYGCYKDTDKPIEEMTTIKDAVRKAIGKDDMKNGMHSSDSVENVQREYGICMK